MKKILMVVLFILLYIPTTALGLETNKVKKLVGYTIVGVKTIQGFKDTKGTELKEKMGGEFEGCEYNRIIIFEDNSILTCKEYHYSYGYNEEAILFSNGRSWKMMVSNSIYVMGE